MQVQEVFMWKLFLLIGFFLGLMSANEGTQMEAEAGAEIPGMDPSEALARRFEEYLEREIKNEDSKVLSSWVPLEADLNSEPRAPQMKLEEGAGEMEEPAPRRILCVDLGGTSLKIAVTNVHPSGEISLEGEVTSYSIPKKNEDMRKETIYSWIAGKIKKFESAIGSEAMPHVGALTFSFPLETSKKTSKVAILHFTKEFDFLPVGPGEEIPLDELNKIMKNTAGLPLRFEVIINDATATLLNALYRNSNAILGVVLGTGTNGAYLEQTKDVAGLPPQLLQMNHYSEGTAHLCALNTEWGGYKDDVIKSLLTDTDRKLDERSHQPGSQLAEKMVGGTYFENYVNEKFGEQRKTILMEVNEMRSRGGEDPYPEEEIPRVRIQQMDVKNLDKIPVGAVDQRTKKTLEDCLGEIIAEARERKTTIVAGFIAGVVVRAEKSGGERKSYYVGLNGSGFLDDEEREAIQRRADENIRRILPEFNKPLVCEYYESASLIGAAFALTKAEEVCRLRSQ